jgi:hypothetical protein
MRSGLLLSFALLFVSSPALAQSARLSYARLPGAESCADQQEFQDRVATQMGGTDPFVSEGPRRIEITLSRRGPGFQGALGLDEGDGVAPRSLEVVGRTCSNVVDDLAVTISMTLRTAKTAPLAPLPALPAPSPEPTPPALLPPPAVVSHTPPRPSPPLAHRPWLFQIGAGASLAGGFSPGPVVGITGLAGARWPAAFLSLQLEGRGDLPASGTAGTGVRVQTGFAGGSLVPCYRRPWFFACGLVSVGRLALSTSSGSVAGFYAGTGPRVGLELPLVRERLSAEVGGDLLVNLTHPALVLRDRALWRVPAVSGLAGLRLVAFF